MALSTGVVSYYKLDESSGNAADTVGSNTLTNTNTVSYAAALINNGAVFAKASNKVLQTSTAILGTAPRDFTVSMWIKIASEVQAADSNSQYVMFGHQDNASAGSREMIFMRYAYNGGTRRLETGVSTSSSGQINYNITLGTTNRYHVVLTCVASALTLYVNGSSVGTATVGGAGNGGSSTRTTLGADSTDGTSSPYDGSIDEVGVWSRGLSSGEVTSLYNGGTGVQYPFTFAYTVALAQGSYTVTGYTLALPVAHTLSIGQGSFTYAGYTLSFINSLWTRQSKSSSVFSNASRSSSSWTNQTKDSSTFTNQSKS